MFNLFAKAKPKAKPPLTRAERRERLLQKLRASKPGWSDEKLLAYASNQAKLQQQQTHGAQLQREFDALVAESAVMLKQMDANAESARATLARPPLEQPSIAVDGELLTATAFKQMQGDLAQSVIAGADGAREMLDEANDIAAQHGLPRVYDR
jgi:hypothetical protein